ncbi:hypothetical protein F4680DRAFT_253602 [Xylaria scruposa]|nr:hypothetical protein F4680DRAFT_253602 [Xylaria scruposa]
MALNAQQSSVYKLSIWLGKNHLAGTPGKEIKLSVDVRALITADEYNFGSGFSFLATPNRTATNQTSFRCLKRIMMSVSPPTWGALRLMVSRVVRKGKPPIHREPELAIEVIFCRFAYIVDLDTEIFILLFRLASLSWRRCCLQNSYPLVSSDAIERLA